MRRWVLCGCSFAAPNEGLMQTHGENMNRGMDDHRNVLHLRPAVQVRTHSHPLCKPCSRFTHFALEHSSPILVQAVFLTRPFAVLVPCFCHWSTKTILPHCRPSALPVGAGRVSWE